MPTLGPNSNLVLIGNSRTGTSYIRTGIANALGIENWKGIFREITQHLDNKEEYIAPLMEKVKNPKHYGRIIKLSAEHIHYIGNSKFEEIISVPNTQTVFVHREEIIATVISLIISRVDNKFFYKGNEQPIESQIETEESIDLIKSAVNKVALNFIRLRDLHTRYDWDYTFIYENIKGVPQQDFEEFNVNNQKFKVDLKRVFTEETKLARFSNPELTVQLIKEELSKHNLQVINKL